MEESEAVCPACEDRAFQAYLANNEKVKHVLEVLVNIIPHWKGQRIGAAELRFVKELLEVNGVEIPQEQE